MEHRDCQNKLSAYLDGEIEIEQIKEIESHLSVCQECKAELNRLNKTKRLINALPIERRSAAFDTKMQKLIADKEKEIESALAKIGKAIWRGDVVKATLSLVAACLILAVGLRLFWAPEKFRPVIIASRGLAQVYSQKQEKWISAKPGLKICRNDRLRLAAYAQLDIETEKYYTIRIKQNSDLSFNQLSSRKDKTTVINVKSGNILVKTKPGFKGSNMYVNTPFARVKVIGTAFILQVNPKQELTWLGVLKGAVAIEGVGDIKETALNRVMVEAGRKTTVKSGNPPAAPQLLSDKEWQLMDELYHIGELPQVALLIGTSSNRVEELMAPCMLYVYDRRPRTLPEEFEGVVRDITQAVRRNDISLHRKAANELNQLLNKYPNPKYDVQFLLFLGAYYNYLDDYKKSISCFEKIIKDFSESDSVSLALCAEAVVYQQSLNEKEKAKQLYRKILELYRDTPEAEYAREALKNL